MRLLFVCAAIALLAGCASTMDKKACLNADWRTIGYQDGSQGRDTSWLERRTSDCSDHSVAPDLDEYLAGRDQGLQEFCKPTRGFQLGSRGGSYRGVCPPQSEGPFLAAYNEGVQLYTLEQRYRGLDSELSHTHAEIDRLGNRIEKETIHLIAEGLSAEERVSIAADIKQMAERRGKLNQQIPQLESERQEAYLALEDYRNYLATRSSEGT